MDAGGGLYMLMMCVPLTSMMAHWIGEMAGEMLRVLAFVPVFTYEAIPCFL